MDASKQTEATIFRVILGPFWRHDEIWEHLLIAFDGDGDCLMLLFSAHALRAQETKEKVTVDDVDRTFWSGCRKVTTPHSIIRW